MNRPPAGARLDPLERLSDERHQIEELFETDARHRRDPDYQPAEATRLATLIFTQLRVHDELETAHLLPALARVVGDHPALARAEARRATVRDALERVEAMSPRDPGYSREMSALAYHSRAWFEGDQNELFTLARERLPDRAALDEQMAAHQEALLSAGGDLGSTTAR